MIKIALMCVAIYGSGCGLAVWFFFMGRIQDLNEQEWPWPVIFLWPLLVFWPLHALAGYYIRRRTRKRK